jgi:SnoaL-like domain
MSDETEIAALVHSYAFLLDDGDVDGVVSLFEHATWRSDASDAIRRGPSEIRPVYEQLLASGEGARTRHLLTNVTISVQPEALHGTCRCYWTVLSTKPAQRIDTILSGQYLDEFVKVDGAWRFASRYITTDLAAT